jgi:hypothetical protein
MARNFQVDKKWYLPEYRKWGYRLFITGSAPVRQILQIRYIHTFPVEYRFLGHTTFGTLILSVFQYKKAGFILPPCRYTRFVLTWESDGTLNDYIYFGCLQESTWKFYV